MVLGSRRPAHQPRRRAPPERATPDRALHAGRGPLRTSRRARCHRSRGQRARERSPAGVRRPGVGHRQFRASHGREWVRRPEERRRSREHVVEFLRTPIHPTRTPGHDRRARGLQRRAPGAQRRTAGLRGGAAGVQRRGTGLVRRARGHQRGIGRPQHRVARARTLTHTRQCRSGEHPSLAHEWPHPSRQRSTYHPLHSPGRSTLPSHQHRHRPPPHRHPARACDTRTGRSPPPGGQRPDDLDLRVVRAHRGFSRTDPALPHLSR